MPGSSLINLLVLQWQLKRVSLSVEYSVEHIFMKKNHNTEIDSYIYIYIKVERYFRQPERKLKLFLCQQSLLRYLELF